MVARDIMTTQVVTIGADATVQAAADLLASVRHSALPVVGPANQPVGVLAYHDLIRLVLPEFLDGTDLSFLPPSAAFFPPADGAGALGDLRVEQVMRREALLEVPPEEPVAEVARLMLTEQAAHVLVVEAGKLVGIIGLGDLVRALVHPRLGESGQDTA